MRREQSFEEFYSRKDKAFFNAKLHKGYQIYTKAIRGPTVQTSAARLQHCHQSNERVYVSFVFRSEPPCCVVT